VRTIRLAGLLGSALLLSGVVFGDTPGERDDWNEVAGDGQSLVFGRFLGKFESTEFRSRRIRLREVATGQNENLDIDEGLGFIAEKLPPGLYEVLGFEAIYYPQSSGPLRPDKYRPIRQRFAVKPKAGDAPSAVILVPADRPVYIGTIRADNTLDGVVYRGHQLRVVDEFDESYRRLTTFYPELAASLERQGIVPARHFMLKPTQTEVPLERVVGLEDPIKQAREYIADGKYRQAISWLETFMPASDDERSEAQLLVGEALLADRAYAEAIEELGEVLLIDPSDQRALRLLARAHAYDGHLEDAQNLYEALAEAVPDDAEANLHLGYLYALNSDALGAHKQFAAAFETDFDYLLHEFGPFLIAMRQALTERVAEYLPPRVIKYTMPPPKGMQSRRASANNAFAVLIDHEGKVIAAQIGAQSKGSTPLMMLSLVKAKYEPASLNGIPVPALVTMGTVAGAQ